MTEEEWFECGDADPMLAALVANDGSERKLRLFACACCRLIPGYLASEPDRQGLELTELDVDNLMPEDAEYPYDGGWDIRWYRRDAWDATWRAVESHRMDRMAGACDHEMVVILHDVFGNPFRDPKVKRAWLTPTVVSLAEAIYAERAFDRLPILADALEDAGCDQADILGHCRTPGEHVRGCWVVDLVLGKE